MLFGVCDLCNETRILKHVYDYWDVHVLDLCKFGCNDARSEKKVKFTTKKFKVIVNLETLFIFNYQVKRNEFHGEYGKEKRYENRCAAPKVD